MINILWAVAAILVLAWIFGFAFHFTGGGLIHLLLVVAIIAVVIRLVAGRRAS